MRKKPMPTKKSNRALNIAIAIWAVCFVSVFVIAAILLYFLNLDPPPGPTGALVAAILGILNIILGIYVLLGWIPVLIIGLRAERTGQRK